MKVGTIRIGTRGSKLAMWQAEYVANLLAKKGLKSDIIPIVTRGDKILDVSIAKIGSKGVFTEEIEEQLKGGVIDIAVHSAKDLQSELPVGFEIIAFDKREKVNDVVVSYKEIDLRDNLVLGTASTRRVAMLKRSFPHIKTVPVRGNLQTRIKKMEEGACDALLLAYAGVHRMNLVDSIKVTLAEDHFIPAVGQGSIAVETHNSLSIEIKNEIRACINHPLTEYQLIAERAFLRKMQGGCSIPVFGLARIENMHLILTGGIISLDGFDMIKYSVQGDAKNAEKLGEKLGTLVLENGGKKILEEIRNSK